MGFLFILTSGALTYANYRRRRLHFPPLIADLDDPIRRERVEVLWSEWFSVLEHGGPDAARTRPASLNETKAAIILGLRLYWKEEYKNHPEFWDAAEHAYMTASASTYFAQQRYSPGLTPPVDEVMAATTEFAKLMEVVAGIPRPRPCTGPVLP